LAKGNFNMQKSYADINLILLAFVEKSQPFALLRFGDGEGLFCFQAKEHFEQYQRACVKHWGQVPTINYRYNIAESIMKAFLSTDIAGLPYYHKGAWWKYALNNFLLIDRDVRSFPAVKCDLNIHIELDSSGILDQLIKGRDVVVLGCRNIERTLKSRGARNVKWLKISPQYRFERRKPRKPFYRQVEAMEKEISKMDLRGKICILGAGVAGKYLGIWMRERGGMVLDMGSVLDKWSGVKSRSWIKKAEQI